MMQLMSRRAKPPQTGRRQGAVQLACLVAWLVALVGVGQAKAGEASAAAQPAPFHDGHFSLAQGDVVAFVGGADVQAAQHSGHLEALLAAGYHGLGLRFRNFGWEGDTVHARPRDVNFPSLEEHLRRARATVIVLQFGRSEALSGRGGLAGFASDYRKFLDECARQTPRLVLVTPPPFEPGGGLLPDLSLRNDDLAEYADAIRRLARERNLPLVDVFAELGGASHRKPRVTYDGLQLTPRGHALAAGAFARRLGLGQLVEAAGAANENGVWGNRAFERLRQVVVAKNRLWFDYWRPQNWAFLGGDRTEQPSSRDHRDPHIRWFPAEMEKFVPLIEAKEREMAELTKNLP